jgi:hypothetical protein
LFPGRIYARIRTTHSPHRLNISATLLLLNISKQKCHDLNQQLHRLNCRNLRYRILPNTCCGSRTNEPKTNSGRTLRPRPNGQRKSWEVPLVHKFNHLLVRWNVISLDWQNNGVLSDTFPTRSRIYIPLRGAVCVKGTKNVIVETLYRRLCICKCLMLMCGSVR